MGKISSLLCRELHAQALLTTVIVHIISCALLWKFTLQTLAPCQVTQQPFIIFWGRKPELWNCRMEAVAFAPLPFSHFSQSQQTEGKPWGAGPQTKGECISNGCRVSHVVMAPCTWSGLCRTHVGPCWGQQIDLLQVDLSGPWFHLWRLWKGLEGGPHTWVAGGGKAQLQRGAGLVLTGARTGDNWQLPRGRNK